MRIVSLLPSLTELVCALGRCAELVGVTHECDFPPVVERLPRLTRSRVHADASSVEIDALVAAEKGSLYNLDERLLAELQPDLILTQEQCDVCAVNEQTVRRAAGRLSGSPRVESVNPVTLDGLFAIFRRVGDLLDARPEAEALIAGFHSTAAEIARRREASGRTRIRRVLLLEWLDPPYSSGHWNPEIIDLAGGMEVIGRAGQESRRITWEQVQSARPETILVAPCGFTLERTEIELRAIEDQPEWRDLAAVRDGSVVLVNGSAFFARPGPRLETSLRIAAAAIDPEACGDLAPPEGQGWRPLMVSH